MRPRAWLSWSSGKDSAWALHTLRQVPDIEVVGLLTTVTAGVDRVSMHGVRRDLVCAQAAAAGLPLRVVEIPSPCPNETYASRMGQVMLDARAEGIEAVAFGDLFLRDIREYRERMLEGTGIKPIFPLWGQGTAALARTMIDGGLRALLTCVDPRRVDPSLCGRAFDHDLLDALPPEVDPCAEYGEFHTFVWDGPMFAHPIEVVPGPHAEHDGFVFCELERAPPPS